MKPTNNIISVVVPAFNEEKELPACLKALIKQDFPKTKFEIIVVDNNSQDKTAAIAQKFGAKVIKEKNKGVIFAKQAGCLQAKGQIIAITDADTIVPGNWLTTIYKILTNGKFIAVTGPAIPQNLPLWGKMLYFPGLYSLILFYKLFKFPLTIHGQNAAFIKKYFLKFGGFDIRYSVAEDELGLLTKLKKYGKVFYNEKLMVKTSNRRFSKGIGRFLKDMLWHYYVGFYLGHLFKKTVIPAYPDIRN